jgi:NitT/TauT family transport system ATP-binding protein
LSFGAGSTPVLDGISLDIRSNEFVGIVGPNGCGKSSLLNVFAGQISLESGHLFWKGLAQAPQKVGFVFQAYEQSLMPWLNCLDNVALPLIANNRPKAERREVARAMVEALDLDLPLDNMPHQMSGGQKQMAVIARALICDPEIILFDEPLASLDYINRLLLLESIQKLLMVKPVPTVMVSHDVDQAVFLCDRIYVLSPRPARVVDEISVDIARPRTRNTILSPDFNAIRSRVLANFADVKLS